MHGNYGLGSIMTKFSVGTSPRHRERRMQKRAKTHCWLHHTSQMVALGVEAEIVSVESKK